MAGVCCCNSGSVCKGTPMCYTRNLVLSTRAMVETTKASYQGSELDEESTVKVP